MRNLVLILIVLFLSSCATAYKINYVSKGMAKDDVISKVGVPSSVSAKGDCEYLNYKLFATDDDAWLGKYTDYYVRLVSGSVESYGRMGDFDSTKDPTININTNNKTETSTKENNTDKMYTELKKLKELYDSNILTQDEYNRKKQDILNRY